MAEAERRSERRPKRRPEREGSRARWWGAGLVVVLFVGGGAVATTRSMGDDAVVPDGVPEAGLEESLEAALEEALELDPTEPTEPTEPAGPAVTDSPDVAVDTAAAAEAAATEPVEWALPTDPSPVEPVPADQRVPKPEAVRGIYVGSWSVGSARRFGELVRLADETEVNAFVIDVKDVTGEVSYASRVPLAVQVGATNRIRIADVRARLATLREHGIYPIARIVVFKDPLLATARPEWSIEREDGTIWEDNKGVHWVDSYNRNVWDYNIELAREAIALGFSEIQWDYIRFPDVPSSYLLEAVYPAQEGRSKTDAVREFMIHSRDRMADLDVELTADVFGITTSTRRDIGIGQVWEKMSDVVDVLLPMVYPSHYPSGSWHFDNPNAAPYQIVKRAMDDGVERSLLIDNAAGIRPWLQAFSMGEPNYGPRHIRAQMDAVYDAGLTEWILWSPSARYPREAFASAAGEVPWFSGMAEALYEPPPVVTPVDSGGSREPLGTPAPNGGR